MHIHCGLRRFAKLTEYALLTQRVKGLMLRGTNGGLETLSAGKRCVEEPKTNAVDTKTVGACPQALLCIVNSQIPINNMFYRHTELLGEPVKSYHVRSVLQPFQEPS
jgi:hypothetical protein